MVGIIDYGIGNVRSIKNSVESLGFKAIITSKHSELMECTALILPGVGAFKSGMESLTSYKLDKTIFEFIDTGKPLMAICLGMQMLFETSEEFGITKGLAVMPGHVKKIQEKPGIPLILPHVGWNKLEMPNNGSWQNIVMENVSEKDYYYFVHSYVCIPNNPNHIIANTKYADIKFCSAVRFNNVFGFQFHPEKSANAGLIILNNFLKMNINE